MSRSIDEYYRQVELYKAALTSGGMYQRAIRHQLRKLHNELSYEEAQIKKAVKRGTPYDDHRMLQAALAPIELKRRALEAAFAQLLHSASGISSPTDTLFYKLFGRHDAASRFWKFMTGAALYATLWVVGLYILVWILLYILPLDFIRENPSLFRIESLTILGILIGIVQSWRKTRRML